MFCSFTFLNFVLFVQEVIAAQSAANGALPALYAIVAENIAGGSFVGPDGLGHIHGRHPCVHEPANQARDVITQRLLWANSELLTGVRWTPPSVKHSNSETIV